MFIALPIQVTTPTDAHRNEATRMYQLLVDSTPMPEHRIIASIAELAQ
jgi:hypothetical protein